MGTLFDIDRLREELEKLEKKSYENDFWDDTEKAQEVIKEMNFYKDKIQEYDNISSKIEECEIILELLDDSEDGGYIDELKETAKNLEKMMEKLKLNTLLSGEFDKNNAILSIHSGAGGLEAQDWAEMLLRMYRRWSENNGFGAETLDCIKDTEGGIKSVTIRVIGTNAYGFLKSEKGVHRLIRISPFDSSGKRHTSFASVDIFPELDDIEEVDIDPSDLKIDTYRASGAGGQHVNTTDSAIRITHIPTGIVVQCQNERSQHSNKATAMRMLASKLMRIKLEERKDRIEDLQGNYNQIGWGSQIRSYVFNPYTMVKDHRTGAEVGNISGVMDGDIDFFINEYLSQKAKENL